MWVVVSAAAHIISKERNEMDKTEMVELIHAEWHDSYSDSGYVWEASRRRLDDAKLLYPELYRQALPIAYASWPKVGRNG